MYLIICTLPILKMANFSTMIKDNAGMTHVPALANSKIYYGGQEYGALLFRSSEEPMPASSSPSVIFNNFNKTAMIGDPQYFPTSDGNRFLWAEMTPPFKYEYTYIDTGGYEPSSVIGAGEVIYVAPPQISNAGIIKYKQSNNHYLYCIFINGSMVYSIEDICPILMPFAYGYGLICFEPLRYEGYKTDYMFVRDITSYTKFGDTKPGWIDDFIKGKNYSAYTSTSATLVRYISVVNLYDEGNNLVRAGVSFDYRDSNLQDENGYVIDNESISKISPVRVTFGINISTPDRLLTWEPSFLYNYFDKDSIKDIIKWRFNPLVRNLSPSNDILINKNVCFLFPGVHTENNLNYFSNWGLYFDWESDNKYYLKFYKNNLDFAKIFTGITDSYGTTSIITSVLGIRVNTPFEVVDFRSPKDLDIYLICYKASVYQSTNINITTDLDFYILKCHINNIYEAMSSATQADFSDHVSFEKVNLNDLYSFNYPMISKTYYFAPIQGFQRNHSITRRFNGSIITSVEEYYPNPPAVGDQWSYIFDAKTIDNNLGYICYDYKKDVLYPYGYGYNYHVLNHNYNISFRTWTGNSWSPTGDIYDLNPLMIDLNKIQESLNYANN